MRTPVIFLAFLAGIVFAAPLLFPSDPMLTNVEAPMQPPSIEHPLGTDTLGRDILSRVLHGGQRTLMTAAIATGVAAGPGALIGLAAGSTNGWGDRLSTAVMNAFIALPGLLSALVVLTLTGPGALPVALAVGFSQIAPYALVTRSAVLRTRAMTYIEAAAATGASNWHITRYHVLPNIAATLAAYTGVTFAYAIVNGAALSFLGLGGEPGTPDWGVMLAESRAAWRIAPWMGLIPGLAITATVMAVNRLADELTSPKR